MKIYTLANTSTNVSLIGAVVLAEDAEGAKRLAARYTPTYTREQDWDIVKVVANFKDSCFLHSYVIR